MASRKVDLPAPDGPITRREQDQPTSVDMPGRRKGGAPARHSPDLAEPLSEARMGLSRLGAVTVKSCQRSSMWGAGEEERWDSSLAGDVSPKSLRGCVG